MNLFEQNIPMQMNYLDCKVKYYHVLNVKGNSYFLLEIKGQGL